MDSGNGLVITVVHGIKHNGLQNTSYMQYVFMSAEWVCLCSQGENASQNGTCGPKWLIQTMTNFL